MESVFKTKAADPTDAVFGVDLEGKTYRKQISGGPHWIVAGTTGSGKSVFVNGLLVSMISHAHPSELYISWIDPKKVEATAYVGLPYCPIDPVTDMSDAYGLVAYLTWLMDERYELLEEMKFKNVVEFNEWVEANPEEAAERDLLKIPYWVLVVDEYADLMSVSPDVEKNLVRLGQKARAAAIHVIIATQRPSADVITPLLKANIPSRICLKVNDSINSQIIIDEPGGELLRGYGDALVKDNIGDITRVQGPYITNDEILSIFAYLRENYDAVEMIDYKSKCVDLGLCEWANTYTDDVPMSDRHLVPVRRRPGGRF